MPQKVFRDPIYGNIVLSLPRDRVLLELIDTASFQRLRRIKQLGVSYLAFHGAEHSRFTHSLGTLHLMTLAFDQVLREAPRSVKPELMRYRHMARIAALLHDIGHGPFSHNFEQVVPRRLAKRHELWGIAIITGDTDIARVLRSYRLNPAHIAQIIEHRFAVCPAVHELLSGHLDVDRMDYLLRDSHATGVKYGIFDWERLLRSLVVYSKQRKLHLAVTHKGLHAIEELILARYFMYDQVYLHKTVLGAEFLLKKILKRAEHVTFASKSANVIEKMCTEQALTVDEYLTLDDALLLSTLASWSTHADPILSDLASRFLNRRLLVSVAASPKEMRRMHDKAVLQARKRGFDPNYYVGILDTSLAPYPLPVVSGATEIAFITPTGTQPISTVSEVIRHFKGKSFPTKRLCMPREIRNSL